MHWLRCLAMTWKVEGSILASSSNVLFVTLYQDEITFVTGAAEFVRVPKSSVPERQHRKINQEESTLSETDV